jgi:membrane protein YdbS with pleckstrin-like domain
MTDRPHDMDPRNDVSRDESAQSPRPGVRSGPPSAGDESTGRGRAPQTGAPGLDAPDGGDERGSQLDPQNEKDLWTGRTSWKEVYPNLLLWLLVTAGVIIAVGAIWTWQYSWWMLSVAAVLLVLMVGRHGYRVLSIHYKLTTQRLFIRRGIFSQTVDQTELLRVDDVKIKQSLIDRMLTIGTVEMISSDRTDANLFIRDVENPEAIAEFIRRHTRLLQRRTLFMEQL